MNPETTAFLDIDTQRDFVDPDGALYIPGAEEIVAHLERLVAFSRQKSIWLLSTVDTHAPDDPEFADFPPHCIVGTEGQAKIPQTSTIPYLLIKSRDGALPPVLDPGTQIIFEKPTLDIFDNPNFAAFVEREKIRSLVVFGLATDYCVRIAALGLRVRGLEVALVEDAVRAVSPEASRAALDEMARAGVRFVTAAEIIAELS